MSTRSCLRRSGRRYRTRGRALARVITPDALPFFRPQDWAYVYSELPAEIRTALPDPREGPRARDNPGRIALLPTSGLGLCLLGAACGDPDGATGPAGGPSR